MNVERNNSASRATKILRTAASHNVQALTYNVWAGVFNLAEITDDNKSEIIEEIMINVKLLRKELESVITYMERTDYPENLWKTYISRTKNSLQVDSLASRWEVYVGQLQQSFVPLQWCAATMPHEEEIITKGDLAEITKQVEELSLSINASDLPSSVKELIQHYLNIIRKSIRQYEIIGSKSFTEVEETLFVDLHKNGELIKQYKDNESIKSIARIFHTILEKSKKLPDSLLKAKKIAEALEYFGVL
jgi:hypothetical protein